MRGWLSLFTRERDPRVHRTGLFVASAELDLISKARPAMAKRWPDVKFTVVAPHGYAQEFAGQPEVLWLEELKSRPVRSLAALRRRHFDLCVVLFAGRPTFRKLKIAALLLNTRRTVFYNENGDSIILDRRHWKQILAHVGYRMGRSHSSVLFCPIGFLYLLLRTLWLTSRARFTACKIQGDIQ